MHDDGSVEIHDAAALDEEKLDLVYACGPLIRHNRAQNLKFPSVRLFKTTNTFLYV